VPVDEALLDRGELGLIGLNVDVDVLQLSDPSPWQSMSIFPRQSATLHAAAC
jgi:hypothetical protein